MPAKSARMDALRAQITQLQTQLAAQAAQAAQVAQAAQAAQPAVMTPVTVKLPAFWPTEPMGWFVQAEAQFATKNVIADQTKYDNLVGALDKETVTRVLDLLVAPPIADKYNTLKARLLGSLSLTRRDRAAKIMDLGPLGDESAIVRLDRMQALRGSEPIDILWEEVFIRQLPDSVRASLANAPMTDMKEFAKMADNVILSQRNTVHLGAIRPKTSQIPSSDSKSDQNLCWNHQKYGKKTWKCRLPDSCKMAKVLAPKPEPKNALEPRQ